MCPTSTGVALLSTVECCGTGVVAPSGTHNGPHLCTFVNVNSTIVFSCYLWYAVAHEGQVWSGVELEGPGGFCII